jgi:hypothetical protein
LAAVASLVVTAGVGFVVVIVFAGPHSDILPSWLQVIVFAAAWIAVIAIPTLVARATWRRLHVGAQQAAQVAPERGD